MLLFKGNLKSCNERVKELVDYEIVSFSVLVVKDVPQFVLGLAKSKGVKSENGIVMRRLDRQKVKLGGVRHYDIFLLKSQPYYAAVKVSSAQSNPEPNVEVKEVGSFEGKKKKKKK
jgi:hypothetical protein